MKGRCRKTLEIEKNEAKEGEAEGYGISNVKRGIRERQQVRLRYKRSWYKDCEKNERKIVRK